MSGLFGGGSNFDAGSAPAPAPAAPSAAVVAPTPPQAPTPYDTQNRAEAALLHRLASGGSNATSLSSAFSSTAGGGRLPTLTGLA